MLTSKNRRHAPRQWSMAWPLWLASALIVAGTARATDCGAAARQDLLRRTESLVISRAPAEPVIGEMPTPEGTRECARITFSIAADGKPIGLAVAESSGHMAFDLAAMRAVGRYRFRQEFLGSFRSYSLVIQGVADQIPPDYFRGTDLQDGRRRFETAGTGAISDEQAKAGGPAPGGGWPALQDAEP